MKGEKEVEFKKYPSIENHYRNKHIEKWLSKFPELKDEGFIIQEKIQGSNFQIIINNDKVSFASRNNILEDNAKFFDYQNVMEKYQNMISKFQSWVKDSHSVDCIRLFGELFGGNIQKGVDYGKEKRFLIFDAYINEEILSQKRIFQLLYELNLDVNEYFVPSVGFVKRLEDALNFESRFNSQILEIENNICEGVVIKPFNNTYVDEFGSVFYIKKKNEEFKEKQKEQKEPKENQNTNLLNLQIEFSRYLNDNRVDSVFSKYGVIESDSDIGKYIKLISDDAMEDFIKDFEFEIAELEEKDKNKINSISGKFIVPILKKYL